MHPSLPSHKLPRTLPSPAGYPSFSVSVAVLRHTTPVASTVIEFTGGPGSWITRTYTAARNNGAFCNGKPIQVWGSRRAYRARLCHAITCMNACLCQHSGRAGCEPPTVPPPPPPLHTPPTAFCCRCPSSTRSARACCARASGRLMVGVRCSQQPVPTAAAAASGHATVASDRRRCPCLTQV